MQGPPGGDRGIELAQRARRRIARIGKERLTRLRLRAFNAAKSTCVI